MFPKSYNKKNERLFLIIVINLVSIIIFYYHTNGIEQKLAWNGASPHNYVAEKINPENFKFNWEAAGVGKYDFSLPMRVYYYLAKYLNIEPSTTLYPYMYIQTFLFLISIAFISDTLFTNRIVTLMSVFIIPVSNLAGLNLARFGTGYGSFLSYPLFYGYAISFSILALGFFLKNKYILCSIFLVFSIYSHTNLGLFSMAFVGGYLLLNPPLFKKKSIITAILIFSFSVFPHFLNIANSASISTGGMDKNIWIKITKMFSYHWYPLTMRLFTKSSINEFFPFLLALIFFFSALRFHDTHSEINKKVFSGILVCSILTFIGIVFSDILPIPVIIKMSPQRSSGLITFFSVLYLIYYLVEKIEIGTTAIRITSFYTMGILVFSNPGLAILPLFILLFTDSKDGYLGFLTINKTTQDILNRYCFRPAGVLILLIFVVTVINDADISFMDHLLNTVFSYLWTPLQYLNPFDNFDFLIKGGIFKTDQALIIVLAFSFVVPITLAILEKFQNAQVNKLLTGILILTSLGIILHLEAHNYSQWQKRYDNIAKSYIDAQLWANVNTPKDALFMTDPTHYYGWRDFSERSSFGNLREWGYAAITYNPNRKKFEEGIRRIKEFGININNITSEDIKSYPSFPYSNNFDEPAKKKYYFSSDSWRLDLSNRYGIDYFVMQKENITNPSKLNVAYENKHYIIYSIN